MKKLLAVFILCAGMGSCVTQAHAQWHHHGGYYRGGYYAGNNWIAPLVIGGVIGYEINRANQPVVVQQPQIVYTQTQPTVQAAPYGYHWQEMIDPQTGVRKIVAVPN
jgi:hypothetical protein